MAGTKDPAIKLFGKTIQLSGTEEIPIGSVYVLASSSSSYEAIDIDEDHLLSSTSQEDKSNRVGEQEERTKDPSRGKPIENKEGGNSPPPNLEELTDQTTSSENNESPKTSSFDKEIPTTKPSKTDEQSENGSSQEKTLKKPDKILPCPRCNSMDTKFCYYNNYNVNQPRHFCKNCQRYWTAGGTMRNVPVGAGRRKNKNAGSHYRQITVSEALQTAQTESSNGIHHSILKPNGTVLTFGSDAPLCESMASVLNLTEKTMRNSSRNGLHGSEEHRIPLSCEGGENKDDHSGGSSVTASNSAEDENRKCLKAPVMQNCHGFPPSLPYFPGAPWPYPWNPAVPPPAYCPSNFPISFYPTPAFWGCTVPGTWSVPWMSPPTSIPSPNSPLGKHSRDGHIFKESNSEKEDSPKESNSERCLWIPKTLRIDDPDEAARSSIWATLGIKNDKANSLNGGGLFKAFQSKGVEKNNMTDTSHVLQANPAALCRSLNFHETS